MNVNILYIIHHFKLEEGLTPNSEKYEICEKNEWETVAANYVNG